MLLLRAIVRVSRSRTAPQGRLFRLDWPPIDPYLLFKILCARDSGKPRAGPLTSEVTSRFQHVRGPPQVPRVQWRLQGSLVNANANVPITAAEQARGRGDPDGAA